jgi:hypothetical protein
MVVPILRPCSSESSVKRSTLVVAVLVEETQGCDTSRCHCKGEESGIMWTSGLLFRKSQVCRLTMSMKREQFLLWLGCRWVVWYCIWFASTCRNASEKNQTFWCKKFANLLFWLWQFCVMNLTVISNVVMKTWRLRWTRLKILDSIVSLTKTLCDQLAETLQHT